MILFVAIATAISTALGGLFAIRLKDKLHLILGFSAGAVLGVSLFDLLPESIELSENFQDLRLIALLIALGFSFYLFIDRFFSLHRHGDCENLSHRGRLGAATLSFHSFLDGIGIGLAFKVSPVVGWAMAAAVLTHDFSDGINTVSIILKNQGLQGDALRWLALDALAPALGVIVTLFFSISQASLGLILAVFTGLFLYIGASDLIPESHHHHPTIWTTLMTILGMAVIYLSIRLVS